MERLYRSAFGPSLALGLLLAIGARVVQMHDVLAWRTAAACWRALERQERKADAVAESQIPPAEWQSHRLGEKERECGTRTDAEGKRVYVRNAWNRAWFGLLDHDSGEPTYNGWGVAGWVSLVAFLPAGLLWAFHRWVR